MARNRLGLQWVRTSDAIRGFVTEYGGTAPRRAVLCTYDFEVERFEAVLFPELTRRGRQFRMLVLADAAALQAEFLRTGQRQFDRYEVAPVRCAKGGVFHPKLIFLTAGRKHLVGIGSANLTAGGLGTNLELMLWANDSTEEGRQLVGGAAHFVGRLLNNQLVQMPSSARDFIEATVAGVRTRQNVIIDSLEQDLLSQMISTVPPSDGTGSAARGLSVLSPWHSAGRMPEGVEPAVIRQLRKGFGAQLTVFTEGRNGRGPDLGVQVRIRAEPPNGAAPNGQEDEDAPGGDSAFDRRPGRVHAKAYLVRAKRGGTLFVGSANCTQPALLRSVSAGGNVEVLVPSGLREREISAFERDLDALFVPTQETFAVTPPARPGVSNGLILCGRLIDGKSGVCLHIEAPEVARGSVLIGSTADKCTVRVDIKAGVGGVSDYAAIEALFPGAVPARSESFWGCVLWEKVGSGAVPFAVSVPLLAPSTDQPDAFLRDLAWEEMGIWPSYNRTDAADSGNGQDDDSQYSDHEEDIKTLTASKHQGELDRLAVAAAVLRKRLAGAAGGKEYARSRLAMVRRTLGSMKVALHIQEVLLEYLGRPGQKNGRRAR